MIEKDETKDVSWYLKNHEQRIGKLEDSMSWVRPLLYLILASNGLSIVINFLHK